MYSLKVFAKQTTEKKPPAGALKRTDREKLAETESRSGKGDAPPPAPPPPGHWNRIHG